MMRVTTNGRRFSFLVPIELRPKTADDLCAYRFVAIGADQIDNYLACAAVRTSFTTKYCMRASGDPEISK